MKIFEKIINLFFGVKGFTGLAVGMCLLMLPAVSSADMMHASKPDSAKKCAICHYQWVYSFYVEHRDGELVQRPDEKEVADEEMCFSCHDGSVVRFPCLCVSWFRSPGGCCSVKTNNDTRKNFRWMKKADFSVQHAIPHMPFQAISKRSLKERFFYVLKIKIPVFASFVIRIKPAGRKMEIIRLI